MYVRFLGIGTDEKVCELFALISENAFDDKFTSDRVIYYQNNT